MLRVGFTSTGKQPLETVPCHDFGKNAVLAPRRFASWRRLRVGFTSSGNRMDLTGGLARQLSRRNAANRRRSAIASAVWKPYFSAFLFPLRSAATVPVHPEASIRHRRPCTTATRLRTSAPRQVLAWL